MTAAAASNKGNPANTSPSAVADSTPRSRTGTAATGTVVAPDVTAASAVAGGRTSRAGSSASSAASGTPLVIGGGGPPTPQPLPSSSGRQQRRVNEWSLLLSALPDLPPASLRLAGPSILPWGGMANACVAIAGGGVKDGRRGQGASGKSATGSTASDTASESASFQYEEDWLEAEEYHDDNDDDVSDSSGSSDDNAAGSTAGGGGAAATKGAGAVPAAATDVELRPIGGSSSIGIGHTPTDSSVVIAPSSVEEEGQPKPTTVVASAHTELTIIRTASAADATASSKSTPPAASSSSSAPSTPQVLSAVSSVAVSAVTAVTGTISSAASAVTSTAGLNPPKAKGVRAGWFRSHQPYGEAFSLLYEPDVAARVNRYVSAFMLETVRNQAVNHLLMSTALGALLAAWQIPALAVNALSFIDAPWSLATTRADKAAKALGEALLSGAQGRRPVTLVGWGLGARVIFKACEMIAAQAD